VTLKLSHPLIFGSLCGDSVRFSRHLSDPGLLWPFYIRHSRESGNLSTTSDRPGKCWEYSPAETHGWIPAFAGMTITLSDALEYEGIIQTLKVIR
jgi:hypothetical protein